MFEAAICLYDGDGLRIKKSEGGVTTVYIYQGYDVIYEKAGGVETKYILAGGKRLAKVTGGTVTYFHTDHLGSTRMLTDQGGQVVARYDYEPFGESLSHSGQDETYRYTGKGEDPESGLYAFGMRLYDPEVGRFITLDPARDGVNWYIYAENNPLRWIDPSGMSAEDYGLRLHLPGVVYYDDLYYTYHRYGVSNLGLSLDSSDSGSSTKLTLNLSLSYLLVYLPPSSSLSKTLINPGVPLNIALETSVFLALFSEFDTSGWKGGGFKSFSALKRALGPAGAGLVWHHLVEQSKIKMFGAEAIHNVGNVIKVTAELNQRLSALYSSKFFEITRSNMMTVRQWLSTQPYWEQYKFALKAIDMVLKGLW